MAQCDFQLLKVTPKGNLFRCTRCGLEPPATKHSKIRATCTDPTATPNIRRPSIVSQVDHYQTAVRRWKKAGSPVRPDGEVERIFEKHCAKCPYYADGICRHENCGCHVGPPNPDSALVKFATAIGVGAPAQAMTNKLKMATEKCPIGKWPEPRWITNADRAAATSRLTGMVPSTVTAVAGVSRSGISSALQIAELLHIHPFSISTECELTELSHGFRFKGARADDGDLLIVDDTVASGTSMKKLKANSKQITGRTKILYAVTFASVDARHLVDFYAEDLDLPHYLEWNFFNSVHSPNTALDFDGILCRDCRTEEDDDGHAYEIFLATAEPKYLPRRVPVPLIVTARLEKYRPQTEAWLSRWGIRWDKLVMGPWASLEERRANYSSQFKGQAFADSTCSIFVESDPRQALAIFKHAQKTVICPTTSEVFT